MKTIEEKNLSTIKYMLSISENKQEAVNSFCSCFKLSQEAVDFLRPYLNEENFSTSLSLSYELAMANKNLFNKDLWEQTSPERKSISFLPHPDYTRSLDNDAVRKIISNDRTTLNEEEISTILSDTGISESFIRNYTHWGDVKAEFLVANSNKLPESVFSLKSIRDKLSDDDISRIMNTRSNISLEFFFSILINCNNFILINKYLDGAINEKLSIEKTDGTIDAAIKRLLEKFPESMFGKVFQVLSIYGQNAKTYSILKYILNMKQPEEDLLIDIYNDFERNGMKADLARYAIEHDFESLIMLMGIQ